MEAQHQMEGLHLFPLSPTTRRRNRGRGRGIIVLDTIHNASILSTPNPRMEAPGMLPTPSPDEMVIQARGRRQIPLTFSPDVHLTLSPSSSSRQKQNKISQLAASNKNNSMSRLLLPTRTSPRKRLTLTDSPPSAAEANQQSANGSTTPSPDKMKRSPITKKFKLEPTLLTATKSDLGLALKGLSQEQVSNLLMDIISKHPEIGEEVRSMMPSPDLVPLEERINYLKRNIFRALPNTRLESKTDSLAYNRVATHLVAFKKAVVDQGKVLIEAHQWASVLDYSLMAWAYVKATPVWDNPPHNNVRKQCFKTLAANCMQALKKGNWDLEICIDIKNKLQLLKQDSEEILPCIKYIDQIMNNGNNTK